MVHASTGRKQTKEHIAKRVASTKKTGRYRTMPIETRLLSKIRKENNGCWIWTGAVFYKPHGNYSQIKVGGKVKLAHRVSYEFYVGQVPIGLELDHLCRNKLCINPEHLEAVTHKENMARRVDINRPICKYGHVYTSETLYINSKGARECKVCRKERAQKYYSKLCFPNK